MHRLICGLTLALSTAASAALLPVARAATASSSSITCSVPGALLAAQPANFNPLNATPKELYCYGFPQRPAGNAKALATWTRAMKAAKHRDQSVQTTHIKGVKFGLHSTTGDSLWAGFGAAASVNGRQGYNDVNADWTVQTHDASADGHTVGDWVGLGGYLSSNLIQAGVSVTSNSTPSYSFWFENIYSGCASCPPNFKATPSVTAGQDVYVDVTWVSPNAQYFLENLTTGSYATYYQTTSHHDTLSAEGMWEDGSIAGGSKTWSTLSQPASSTMDDVYVWDLQSNPYSIDTTSYDKFWAAPAGDSQAWMGACNMRANGVFDIAPTNCS